MATYRFPDDTCNVAKLNPNAAPIGVLVDDEYLPFLKVKGDLRTQIKDALGGSLIDYANVQLVYTSSPFWACELVAEWDETGEADNHAIALLAIECEVRKALKDNEEEGDRRSGVAFCEEEDTAPDDPAPSLERSDRISS
jgi:hypothetical protein